MLHSTRLASLFGGSTKRGATFPMKQLSFEYALFLKHLDTGYRADLCAWNWKKRFRSLKNAEQSLSASLLAAGGWQPSGLTVVSSVKYEYVAEGTWQTAEDAEPISADGADDGAGRLMGVLMHDYELGSPIELGSRGSFQFQTDGDLYLRCRDGWNEIADNKGKISVKLPRETQ